MIQFDPWELLGKAWVAVAGILAWIFKRHLDEDRQLAARVGVIEQTCARRTDISDLNEKIDTNHRQIIDLLNRR